MLHGILEIGLITMKKELNEQTKENIHHWCSSFLFTNKPSTKPRDGGTDAERQYHVKARHAVEDHQEAKRIEREEAWQI